MRAGSTAKPCSASPASSIVRNGFCAARGTLGQRRPAAYFYAGKRDALRRTSDHRRLCGASLARPGAGRLRAFRGRSTRRRRFDSRRPQQQPAQTVADDAADRIRARFRRGCARACWESRPMICSGRRRSSCLPEIRTSSSPCAIRRRSIARSLDLAGVRALHDGSVSDHGVFVFAPTAAGAYSRMFAPEHGVIEDPATGSADGPLAAYMMRHGLAPARDGTLLVSEQGTKWAGAACCTLPFTASTGQDGIEVGGSVVEFARGRSRASKRAWFGRLPVRHRGASVRCRPGIGVRCVQRCFESRLEAEFQQRASLIAPDFAGGMVEPGRMLGQPRHR